MSSTIINDRLIIVTGAAGGLGGGLVESLLDAGYTNIVCQYRSRVGKLDGSKVKLVQSDLSDEISVKNFAKTVVQDLGAPWAVINVAGSSSNGMSWKLSLDDYRKVIDNNLTSTFLTCREFIPSMRDRSGGRIINLSSVVAHSGVVGASHYCAAKAGIEGYTRSIALELAPRRITANALALGYFDVGIIDQVPKNLQDVISSNTPLKRFGKINEFSSIVKYLLSDESEFMTGEVINVNGGYHL